jgi:hypothetical protein
VQHLQLGVKTDCEVELRHSSHTTHHTPHTKQARRINLPSTVPALSVSLGGHKDGRDYPLMSPLATLQVMAAHRRDDMMLESSRSGRDGQNHDAHVAPVAHHRI